MKIENAYVVSSLFQNVSETDPLKKLELAPLESKIRASIFFIIKKKEMFNTVRIWIHRIKKCLN